MSYPKITYNNGSPQTLTFGFPPVQKPAQYGTSLILDDYLEREATRYDSISSSGVKQSIFERIDKFLTLQLDFLPQADLPAWQLFMDHALTGAEFDYYPDAAQSEHATFTLEDNNFKPRLNLRGYDRVTLKFRLVVADDSGS